MKRLTEVLEDGQDRADITPLIDVIFMLLLFFIITTTFAEDTFFPIELPKAERAPDVRTPADTAVVEITNPTAFPARVKVLAETAERSAKPLGPNYLADAPVVEVEPGATVRTTARARR